MPRAAPLATVSNRNHSASILISIWIREAGSRRYPSLCHESLTKQVDFLFCGAKRTTSPSWSTEDRPARYELVRIFGTSRWQSESWMTLAITLTALVAQELWTHCELGGTPCFSESPANKCLVTNRNSIMQLQTVSVERRLRRH